MRTQLCQWAAIRHEQHPGLGTAHWIDLNLVWTCVYCLGNARDNDSSSAEPLVRSTARSGGILHFLQSIHQHYCLGLEKHDVCAQRFLSMLQCSWQSWHRTCHKAAEFGWLLVFCLICKPTATIQAQFEAFAILFTVQIDISRVNSCEFTLSPIYKQTSLCKGSLHQTGLFNVPHREVPEPNLITHKGYSTRAISILTADLSRGNQNSVQQCLFVCLWSAWIPSRNLTVYNFPPLLLPRLFLGRSPVLDGAGGVVSSGLFMWASAFRKIRMRFLPFSLPLL